MLQPLIIQFSIQLCVHGHLREVKNEIFSSKSGRGCLQEVVAYKRFQTY